MARNQVTPQSIPSGPSAPELITVLIPTRERADTLEYSLTTCVNQTDDKLRILVSDNASQDNTRGVVERFRRRDKRVEYINPGRRLGMSEHWEFALGHVKQGFVTVLGDDDALFPDSLTTIRETLRTRPDTNAISWPFSFYGYPSLFTPSKNHLGIAFGKRNEVRKSRDWLARVIAFEVFYFELPMVYHGLVRVTVLDKIRARSGRLISSSVPDVYLAIAVAASTENYYRLSNSLTLCGTSHHSYGTAGITLGEDSPIVRAFLNESGLGTHPLVPYLQLIPVIVLECILRARDAGILPNNLPIAYERCISRAFTELYTAGHSEKVFKDYLGRLEELCRRIGQTDHLARLKSYDATARKTLEDELALMPWPPRHQIVANLANTGVKDVAAAVGVAAMISRDDVLREILIESSREVHEVRTAFDNRLKQLRELDALARSQQKDLEKRHLEFTERIASLGQQLAETHAESTARFHQIEKLTEWLKISAKDSEDRQRRIDQLTARLAATEPDQDEASKPPTVTSAPQSG
jgi:glycosyltransferase involved in cell wall biosynthesis